MSTLNDKELTLNTDLFLMASVAKDKPYVEPSEKVSEDKSGTDQEHRMKDIFAKERSQLDNIMSFIGSEKITQEKGVSELNARDTASNMDVMKELDNLLGNNELDERSRESQILIDAFVAKLVSSNIASVKEEDFKQEKLTEVNGLKSEELWKKIIRDDHEKDGISIGGRSIQSLKTMEHLQRWPKFVTLRKGSMIEKSPT